MYIDSNALIRFIEGESRGFLFLIEQAACDLVQLFTSELTLAEVLVGPLKSGRSDLVSIYDDLLTSDDLLEVVPVDLHILRRSAEIRATVGNKGPDAIHVATALRSRCTIFVSSDERIRLLEPLKRVQVERVDDMDAWQ